MTPESNEELHLRVIAEMAIARTFLMAICRQVSDLPRLIEDFRQGVEEVRGLQEALTGKSDKRLDHFEELYMRLVASDPDTDQSSPGQWNF